MPDQAETRGTLNLQSDVATTPGRSIGNDVLANRGCVFGIDSRLLPGQAVTGNHVSTNAARDTWAAPRITPGVRLAGEAATTTASRLIASGDPSAIA